MIETSYTLFQAIYQTCYLIFDEWFIADTVFATDNVHFVVALCVILMSLNFVRAHD